MPKKIKKRIEKKLSKHKNLNHLYQKLKLANFLWLLSLKLKNIFSKKIKVGFGPIISGENDLKSRKWHIDPIVNIINKHSKKYTAGVFFHGGNLDKFDIIVIVRLFDRISNDYIKKLKSKNKIFIYHIIDNPEHCERNYEKDIEFIRLMDGIIYCNPLQEKQVKKNNPQITLIQSPIINNEYKKDYHNHNPIRILWEGHKLHFPPMEKIISILRKLNKAHRLKLVLFSNMTEENIKEKNKEIIKIIQWEKDIRDKILANSDIAVTIKKNTKYIQQKPNTKVVSYLAAGLPLICTPSPSDKLAVEHEKTGFHAYSKKDWEKYLKLLIQNKELREKIGKQGRKHVYKNNTIHKITKEHIDFFNKILSKIIKL